MKALIVDPAVHSHGGHHTAAVKRLQNELSTRGIEAPCLGSAFAEPDVVRDLACTPSFARSVYGRDYSGPKQFDLGVARMSRELRRALRPHGAWPDVVILPCCDPVLAASVARVLRCHPLRPAPQILMWLLYGPHHLLAPDDPAAASFKDEARRAFTALAGAVGKRQLIAAYCETDAMAQFYRDLLPFDVNVAPGAGIALPAAPPPAAPHRINVTTLGFANRSKGYCLLPDAITSVLQRHAESDFTVHGVVAGSDAEQEAGTFDRLVQLGGRVVARRDVLTDADYLRLLLRADLLLLPYDPEVYRSRGSAIFTQAQRLGIPVVAPSGCAFARPAFEAGWGVGFSDYSASGLADAIVQALGRIAPLKTHAMAAAANSKDELGAILQATLEAARARPRHGVTDAVWRLLGRTLQAE